MSSGIRSDASGTFGALTFGGDDAVTFDATGIQAGSYKAGSIVAADFADGALIENAPVGIGYGTGAGGTVTQATSKATAVTLNKPCGQITMHNSSLAAGGVVSFQFNNSLITASDALAVSVVNGSVAAPEQYIVTSGAANGAAQINVRSMNNAPMAEAVVIDFKLIKGATY